MMADEHDNTAASSAQEATGIYPFASGYPEEAGTARGPLPDWQAADQPLPDLPVMEQLPDPDALPDPGYPPMPATPPPASQPPPAPPPWPSASPLPQPPAPTAPPAATPTVWTPRASTPPVGPEPSSATARHVRPAQARPQEKFSGGEGEPPTLPQRQPEQRHSPQRPPDVQPTWHAFPYPAPRRPESAPTPPIPQRQPEPRPSAQRPLDVQSTWTPDPYTAPRPPEAAPPLRGPSVLWSQVRAGSDVPAAPLLPESPLPAVPGPATTAPPEGAPAAPAEAAWAAPSEAAWAAPSEVGPHGPPGQRQSADTLTSELLLPGKRATPDGGWRRTVYRATGGLVHIGESAASMRRRELVGRVRAPVAGGHYRVAVLSLKGGVGKTTATVGLGSTLASLRGDRVIAVDGNPDRGTLSDKVRLETPATIRDLLNERSLVTRYADVRAYTSQAPSRLEILASDRDPGVSVAFSADDYRAVTGVLEHYYSICITDCGTGLLHSAMAGILELADQIVLVSSPSVDGARSASATLDWLEAHGYADLVRDGVVALSAVRRRSKSTVDLDRLEQHFAARSRAVVRVPYDPHLEEGAEVELELLNEETADAYLDLAALVADGFAHPRRSAASTTPRSPFA
jgi:MinD-like ATPase involved in chromosome partitioning or flagellar assembly